MKNIYLIFFLLFGLVFQANADIVRKGATIKGLQTYEDGFTSQGDADIRTGVGSILKLGNIGNFAGGELSSLDFYESTTRLGYLEWNPTGNLFSLKNNTGTTSELILSDTITFEVNNTSAGFIASNGTWTTGFSSFSNADLALDIGGSGYLRTGVGINIGTPSGSYGSVGQNATPNASGGWNYQYGSDGVAILHFKNVSGSGAGITFLTAGSGTGGTPITPTSIGGSTLAGAWMLGVNNIDQDNTIYGSFLRLSTPTTGLAATNPRGLSIDYGATPAFQIQYTPNNGATIFKAGSGLANTHMVFNFSGATDFYAGSTNVGGYGSTGVWTIGQTPSGADFSQMSLGSNSSTNIFRETSNGDVREVIVLGRSSTENGSEIYVKFFENGSAASTPGTEAGGIRRNAGDTDYEFYNASDARLKNIKGEYEGGLDIVNNIPVKIYSWKDSIEPKDSVGWIAQDVQKYLPSAVGSHEINGEEYLNLGTSAMIPVMWNAIQELSKQNICLRDADTKEARLACF